MSQTASALVQKVWSYAHVLRDEGLGFMEYTEQITYLLFIKLAWEQREETQLCDIPSRHNWNSLRSICENIELKARYEEALQSLSKRPGLLGLIFAKPQSKIDDPAKLRHLVNLIDEETWSSLDFDVKGEIYESLLARNSEDVRGGAGQYFTPRPVIRAIIEVMRPMPGMVIFDPASGTGGFLLAAYDRLRNLVSNKSEERFLRTKALHGTDIVTNVARLCAMNLYLHGIGLDPNNPPVEIADSLASKPNRKVDMILTNPPFGKKSSVTAISDDRKIEKNDITYSRSDFWATTSNKQLNFVQHVYSALRDGGTAAMVVPDNVLFESGAGETIRRELLNNADVHTLLRLPTGIWYSTGVKANVIFFDKRPSKNKALWVYDLRTNKNFTLRNKPIRFDDLKEFIECFCATDRDKRKEAERFKRFSHSDILNSNRASLDLVWLSSDAFSDPRDLPPHDILAGEVISLLKEAIGQFESAVSVTKKRTRKK